MKPVRFHGEASQELLAAARWYERQRPGLAERLFAEIDTALELVRQRPRSFPVVEYVDEIVLRRALLRRFPYALIFAELADELRIFAIAHSRRSPGYWLRRLGDP